MTILLGIGLLLGITFPIWGSAIAHTIDERRRKRNGWTKRA